MIIIYRRGKTDLGPYFSDRLIEEQKAKERKYNEKGTR